MKLLDEFQAAVVIIITQNDEERTKPATVAGANVQKDLGQLGIRKMSRE